MGLSLNSPRSRFISFKIYYFFIFFSIGILSTLLSIYFKDDLKLRGDQIGFIVSLTPVVSIFAQPFWGAMNDYFRKPRIILFCILASSATIGLIYSLPTTYLLLIIVNVLLAFFQSAVIPLSDNAALGFSQKSGYDYSSMRLYGALGFAVAVLVGGKISDLLGLHVIFYFYMGSFLVSALISLLLPHQSSSLAQRPQVTKMFGVLLREKRYLVFLFVVFCVFGPINANNTYYGLLVTDLGGTLTSVGLAFLFATGSEAPMMKFTPQIMNKLGMEKAILFASSVSILRWVLYFFHPPLIVVYLTSLLQGLSVGVFIPIAVQYVRKLVPDPSILATSLSVYQAIGLGLGAWFSTYIGGLLLDRFSIYSVYGFFAALSLLGCFTMYQLSKRIEHKE